MTNKIYLPNKINVGYNKNKDTYTGKLAYVIYFDEKGKLRKEKSWDSWRDKKLATDIYDNVPTEGFVLDKKAGGRSGSYGHDIRKTYARVYDPRGFEFEITVPNLLYILENTSSIKGKGLEGKFIYGWEGSELVLIPESAPEFNQHKEFSELVASKKSVQQKDLVPGATYLTNNKTEVIYLGRFDKWELGGERTIRPDGSRYDYEDINKGLHHFFLEGRSDYRNQPQYLIMRSISGRILKEVSNVPVPNYAELMDELEHQVEYSPFDFKLDKYWPVTEEVLKKEMELETYYHGMNVYLNVNGLELAAYLSPVDSPDLSDEDDEDDEDDDNIYAARSNRLKKSNQYVFSSVCRATPAPEKELTYSNANSYWPRKIDTREEEAIKVLDAAGHSYKGYGEGKVGAPLKTLLETYKPTYKQEYLKNGKEKH